jgi:coenzyme F420-0:L-glutamate ligase/coenzyme F420-1:gamma-L-glutamate ligase
MEIHALVDIPLISPGDDLATIILDAVESGHISVKDGDIFIIAQKIISKAENRYIDLEDITPSDQANKLAITVEKDPRLVELILSESKEVVRAVPGILIVVHRLGHVTANAGIDASNIPISDEGKESVLLLPEDPDATCKRLRDRFEEQFLMRIGVIISDSVGRAWRNGSIGTALGTAGVPALLDRVGEEDLYKRPLRVTQVGLADQLASAAALVMGEGAEGQPVVRVSGLHWESVGTDSQLLLRPKENDLFR